MQSNTDNFLIWGIQRILQDKEIKKTHNQELKKYCDTILTELKEKIVENGVSSVLPPVKSDIDTLMNNPKYFKPFEIAFSSKSQSIIVIALDCLQKLIAYGHISNTGLYKDTNERLIDKIITFICEAFQDGHSVDAVQLQIIKAILTIVINPNLEVHANNLIAMVRTCYSIFLASKDTVNQTTAKATLTQMLNSIFNKMEMETIKIAENTEIICDTIDEEECEKSETNLDNETNEVNLEIVKSVIESIVDEVFNREKDVERPNESIEDDLVNYSIEGSMTESQTMPSNKSFADITQKDAFLVFRSLCRLSMKALPEGNIDPKSHDLRSKILSLELLLNILQNSGPVFKQNEVFINAIKQYLCVSLSKNGVSPIPEVFELSLSIFLSLLSNFKQHLKRQTEVFFKEIFLYILESPRSSFIHKDLVLEALKRISMNAQCVVDIYVNYDCDLSSANIFERLVNDLAKIAQGRQLNETGGQFHNKTARIKALDCLFHILQCMVEWSRELYVSPESHSFFGAEPERHEGISGSGVAPKTDRSSGSQLEKISSSNSVNSRSSSQSSLARSGSATHLGLNALPGLPNTVDNPEHFASRKQQKELFEHGIGLFNRKPLKGLNYLQSQRLLGPAVEDVAEFLHKDDRLDKTAIGDFLGDNDKYNIEVMYAFVDQFEFSGREFVASLREFLSGFRLPGEAQKIDRLMEKFAARYCECNPKNLQFKSADTAYVLAYSIIMLTTDLHSAHIKTRNRMRKEEYIKMNRGINESGDLDIEYLGSIYDEIAGNEIKIKESTVDKKHSSYVDIKQIALISEKQRKLLFNMEMEEMAKTAKELIESISHVESDFTSATHHEHVRPMFKLAWTPFLAAFSVGLQDCDDTEISRYCLEGIRCAIRIACIFKMELERNAYIQALSRFTLLITGSSSNGIKPKNVDTIKTLISVAHTDGNYLGASWLEILRCISQLESAQLIGGTGPPHSKVLTDNGPTLFSKRMGLFLTNDMKKFTNKTETAVNPANFSNRTTRMSGGDSDSMTGINMSSLLVDQQKNIAILQEVMGETGSQSVVVAVDKVFTGSVRLDGDAIVDFVRALCQVSRDELLLPQPRIFSLQKLVEISYYNMGRIRLQWSRVWQVIGEHFTNAGLSPNEDVAIFATDSLRQLAVKFIEKGEFPNFHFQKEFLRPFVNIMEAKAYLSRNVEDMVVRCVAQLVQSHWANIRSGWTNVFIVFMRAARGASLENESIVDLAFGTCSFVVKEVFKTSFSLVVDSFQNLVTSLAEFACNTNFPDINMESIRLIRLCAKYVDEQGFLFKEMSSKNSFLSSADNTQFSYKQPDDDDEIWNKGWMPVLSELYRVINNCKLDVRTRGLTVFFEIIKSYGNRFKSDWWRDTFSVVFQVFQHMPSGIDNANSGYGIPKFSGPNDRSEWLNTTCNHTLYAVVDVFSQYYDKLHSVLLDDLLVKLKWCCLQDYEQLARSGTSCLETLIISNGQKFSSEIWAKTSALLIEVFDLSTPKQLLSWKPISYKDKMDPGEDTTRLNENKTQTFASLLVKCVVQFELIQAINNVVFYPAASKKEDAELWRKANQLASACTWMDQSNESMEHKRLNDYRGTSEPPQRNYNTEADTSSLDTRIQPLRSESSVSIATESIDEHLNHWGLELPKEGLYMFLTPGQLYNLVESLLKSHEFAKNFNSDQEQRNLLWKAGFKGKAKPNLMKQETHSLSLAIRILFKLSEDSRINGSSEVTIELVEKKLISVINDSLRYFRNLSTESHRESWNSIIVLILSRFFDANLSEDRFKNYAVNFYPNLCDFVTLTSLPIQIRALYRGFLLRFGGFVTHAM